MLKLSFSWDDGAPEDFKLARLCEKYTMPSILFVPTENREGLKVLSSSDIRSIQSLLISIGAHTQHHTYLTELPIADVYNEVVDNKKFLEDVLGHSVQDFSFPGGKYNKLILGVIENEFKTFRTADTMCSSSLQKNVIRPTFHFYPRGKKSLVINALRCKDALLPLCIKKMFETNDYFELLKMIIEIAAESNKEFFIHIWGHSWEIEQFGLWQELEALFSWVRQYHASNICRYPAPYANA